MKTLNLSTTLMLLLGTVTLSSDDTTVDIQVAAIQNATGEKKIQLMNQFKIQVFTLNKKEREVAISKLLEKVQATPQTKAQVREKSRVSQMQQGVNTKRTEFMQQSGRQAMQPGSANKFNGRK